MSSCLLRPRLYSGVDKKRIAILLILNPVTFLWEEILLNSCQNFQARGGGQEEVVQVVQVVQVEEVQQKLWVPLLAELSAQLSAEQQRRRQLQQVQAGILQLRLSLSRARARALSLSRSRTYTHTHTRSNF